MAAKPPAGSGQQLVCVNRLSLAHPRLLLLRHRHDALAGCPRLFNLEDVEEIRVADQRAYAGRELHAGLEDDGEMKTLSLTRLADL